MTNYDFLVSIESTNSNDAFILGPGRNLITGEASFRTHFGEPSTLEQDLLVVASAIYASDLVAIRDEREMVTRKIRLTIPVVNFQAFMRVSEDIEYALYLLSYDRWELNFVPQGGIPEANHVWPKNPGVTLLFSGGLDSLTQGVVLATQEDSLQLVSHDSGNQVIAASQKELAKYVAGIGRKVSHYSFRVAGQERGGLPFPAEKESSQRTRSFLFLALASLSARRTGHHRVVYIAENGQMAIHIPLTAARIGSFSTRTAHPEAVATLQGVFSAILGVELIFENPYLYKTKAEVVAPLCKDHAQIIAKSVSCWRASRVQGEYKHCGECIPCLVRRIALEANGIKLVEWSRDLLDENIGSLSEDDIGKRNLLELCEFVIHFGGSASDTDLMLRFPDLISAYFDQEQATAMYRRFATEALQVLGSYEPLRRLLL